MKFKRISILISIILLLSTLSGCMMAGVGKDRLYLKMGRKELLRLDDEELCYAIMRRDMVLEDMYYIDEIMDIYVGAQRNIYVIQLFLFEYEDGGLLTYFCNGSCYTMPYIQKAFEAIGADDYLYVLNEFIDESGIDMNDVEHFNIESDDQYMQFLKDYHFEKYEILFDMLLRKQPLESKMADYIRENIEEFINYEFY